MIVSLNPEGDLLQEYLHAHHIRFPVAGVPWEEGRQLNYGNGFPAFVLLNRAGIVCRVGQGIGPHDGYFTTSKAGLISAIESIAAVR